MPYVTSDGVMVQKSPFTIFGFFWSVCNFFYLFYKTLWDPHYNKFGEKYKSETRRPGSGPGGPPSRRFGGFNSGSSPSPPPAGGCGCG